MNCYICGGDKYVDDHHLDCCEGRLSPEIVPLCRRCHRTYHDLGVEWFDDEYLDKAIEIENRRREIGNAQDGVVNPSPLLRREDVKRSDYWNKVHGIKVPKKATTSDKARVIFSGRGVEPLPGWAWFFQHYNDPYPDLAIEITAGGSKSISLNSNYRKGMIRRFITEARK